MPYRPRPAARPALSLALATLALVVTGEAAAQNRSVAPAAAVTKADPGIIPLPLTPIVPAGQRACTLRTATGLGYTVLRAGSGAKPAADATVLVNYIGYLAATGAVFDQNTQTPMPVGAVIPGFSQGLQLLQRGSVIRLCIPAALGYGAQASGPIPANADLVFQVELLDFKTAAEIAELRKTAPGDAASETPKP